MSMHDTNVDKTVAKLEDQLTLWGARLNEVVAKAEVAGMEAKIGSKKHLEALKTKLDAARVTLNDVKAAGGDKWGDFKDGVDASWKELEEAFQKLTH